MKKLALLFTLFLSTSALGQIWYPYGGGGGVSCALCTLNSLQKGDGAGGLTDSAISDDGTTVTIGRATITEGAASGLNQAGTSLTIQPKNGTGTGGSGSLIFQTAPVAASSSTANTMTTALTIDNTQKATFAGTVIVPVGAQSTPSITFTGDTTTGFGNLSAHRVFLSLNGAYQAIWDSSGLNIEATKGLCSTAAGFSGAADICLVRDAAGVWQINGGTTGTTKGGLAIIGDANGSKITEASTTELITLNTGGTTTDSSANLIPANAHIKAIVYRVTTTITTATNFEFTGATDTFSYQDSTGVILLTGLTSGTTGVLTRTDTGVGAGYDLTGSSAQKLRITTTGTPGAGAIRVTVFYQVFTPPTS